VSGPTGMPQAQIEHELPGRLRLRIPSRRGDRTFFEAAGQRIAAMPGVRSIHANPLTGSLLVGHGTSTDAIASFARERGLFDLPSSETLPARREPVRRTPPAGLPAPLSLAAAGLAGAGLYQAARGQVLGSASENLWNAYTAYAVQRKPWIAAALAGFGVVQAARGQGLGSAVSLFLYAINARRMAQRQPPEPAT